MMVIVNKLFMHDLCQKEIVVTENGLIWDVISINSHLGYASLAKQARQVIQSL
jgi:hypothetical protein